MKLMTSNPVLTNPPQPEQLSLVLEQLSDWGAVLHNIAALSTITIMLTTLTGGMIKLNYPNSNLVPDSIQIPIEQKVDAILDSLNF